MASKEERKRDRLRYRVWRRFCSRAKRRFGEATGPLPWKGCGKAIVDALMTEFKVNNSLDKDDCTMVLTWPDQATQLDLSKVKLLPFDEAIHRPRRLGSYNKPCKKCGQ